MIILLIIVIIKYFRKYMKFSLESQPYSTLAPDIRAIPSADSRIVEDFTDFDAGFLNFCILYK